MSIPTPKYAIGATVYAANTRQSPSFEPCPDCLGTKVWHSVLASGEELDFSCPTCREGYQGSSGRLRYTRVEGYVEELTIGSVRFDTASEYPVKYMCVETGVGSGRVYEEHRLQATLEEAQALLPKMVADYTAALEKRRAFNRSSRIKENAGSMAAHYRAKIRQCKREIESCERGLAREAQKKEVR